MSAANSSSLHPEASTIFFSIALIFLVIIALIWIYHYISFSFYRKTKQIETNALKDATDYEIQIMQAKHNFQVEEEKLYKDFKDNWTRLNESLTQLKTDSNQLKLHLDQLKRAKKLADAKASIGLFRDELNILSTVIDNKD